MGKKSTHELRQGRQPWANQKMEMIRHQQPGEAIDTGLFKEKLMVLHEIPAVIVVQKYVTTLDTPNDDVLKQVPNVKTRCAWHIRSFNMVCC